MHDLRNHRPTSWGRRLLVACGLWCIVGLLGSATNAHAENWPGWRGPRGDGTSMEIQVPLHWNGATGENVRWKADVPGVGHSSPIIWDRHIFLTSCLEETGDRLLLCYNRDTGELNWQRTVLTCPLETRHSRNSCASGTPVTDGRTVWVSFLEVDGHTAPAINVDGPRDCTPGRIVVAAYDFAGGNLWRASPGDFASVHGFCSSPILYDNLLIINGDHDGESYLAALDQQTGATVWKTPRRHRTRSYVTPIIRDIDGHDELVVSGSRCIAGFDPHDGRRLWNIEGPCEQFVASMVYDGDQFYMTAGFPTHHVMAIRPGGEGDVTHTHVAWHVRDAACYVPSPVVVGRYLIVADDRGTANCYDTTTGERFWRTRIGGNIGGSLIVAGGLVYITADDGTTTIIRPGPEFEQLARNELGEKVQSSPAVSEGALFQRGADHLFCIEEEEESSR